MPSIVTLMQLSRSVLWTTIATGDVRNERYLIESTGTYNFLIIFLNFPATPQYLALHCVSMGILYVFNNSLLTSRKNLRPVDG